MIEFDSEKQKEKTNYLSSERKFYIPIPEEMIKNIIIKNPSDKLTVVTKKAPKYKNTSFFLLSIFIS